LSSRPVAADTRLLALDLYQILKELDPKHWRDELSDKAFQGIKRVEARISALLDVTWSGLGSDAVRRALDELHGVLREWLPHLAPQLDLDREKVRQRWAEFRLKAQPAYENLVLRLKAMRIHVPTLRPTNHARNLLHISAGLLATGVIQFLLPHHAVPWLAFGLAAFAWSCEGSRRIWPQVNDALMAVLGRFAHPHEWRRVNSATWYCSALFLLGQTRAPLLWQVAIAVLGFADPAAALVGRRFGRTRLLHGRTLEGSLTFVGVGTLSSLALILAFHPSVGFFQALVIAQGGAVLGAVAELVSCRVDDNLSVPLAAAAGSGVVASLLGLNLLF
jgi:dolichol kinase